jgi:hypothetical protein
MADTYGRFGWLVWLAKASAVFFLAVIALTVVVTVAAGILAFSNTHDTMTIATYGLMTLGEMALALAVLVGYGVVCAHAGGHATLDAVDSHLIRLESVLEASQTELKRLANLAQLSDQAKVMIYRERELDAVQEIVNACLLRQDYAQAEKIIERMENQFGYQVEAERLRTAVAVNRTATEEGKINAAIDRVNQIIIERNWDRALRESQRLAAAYPEDERVKALPARIAEAKNQNKRELLGKYDEAVTRGDLDASIELLRELDRYLTPQEAAAMQESARGVFRAKLHNLGMQFALAVTDERWSAAVQIGEQIVHGYPNSRMAGEVRQKLDALRQLTASAGAR